MSEDDAEEKLGGDTSFDQLMKDAVALKSAQLSRLRPKFDSWPEFHQAGLYYSDNWKTQRQSSQEEQCSAFDHKKAEGVDLLTQGDAQKALFRFEEALCLFRWVESKKPNWKNEGIEDDDLTVHEPEDVPDIRNRVLSVYLNISLCCIRLGKHKDAVVACSEVLRIDPRNVKALYRKAVALAEPAGSDLDDYKVAIKLLVQAVEIDPANTEVRSKLSEYREFLKAQQVKSKETFHSFFKKPLGLEDTKENPQQPPNSQVNETDQYILTQALGTREKTHSGTQGGKPLIRSPCTSVKAKRSQELEERTPNPTVETRLPETLG